MPCDTLNGGTIIERFITDETVNTIVKEAFSYNKDRLEYIQKKQEGR